MAASPRAVAANPVQGTESAFPAAPMSPEPKRPRGRDQSTATPMDQGSTLPQVIRGLSETHGDLAVEKVFTQTIHDAVDHNAMVLMEALKRVAALEQALTTAVTTTAHVASEADAYVKRVDTQLRTELDSLTARLDAELKSTSAAALEKFNILQGIA